MNTNTVNTNNIHHDDDQNDNDEYECDYLVIGAGTAGMSFIDTTLTENPTATIILIDRNDQPGGHWTAAYPFVKLHQGSFAYGVNSTRLGTSVTKKGYEAGDHAVRATGEEILEYYKKVLQTFQASGRFRSFFRSNYEGQEDRTRTSASTSTHGSTHGSTHSIITSTSNGDKRIVIHCQKTVMIHSKVIVPSIRTKQLFPIHNNINYITVNDLPKATSSNQYTNYVILGAGKTSVDAILELLHSGIHQSSITWVISRHVWFLLRDKALAHENHFKGTDIFVKPFSRENSVKDVFLHWEKDGLVGRLHPHRENEFPEVFKGATIETEELHLLRTVQDIIELGRIQSIQKDGTMIFEQNQQVQLNSPNNSTVFIDCMATDFYGYNSFAKDFQTFQPNRINLGPLPILFNPSFTSALIAFIEASTMTNDDVKNSCFFISNNTSEPYDRYDSFIRSLYLQIKTTDVLMKTYPPTAKFFFNSRTNTDAPFHYKGGMINFLWTGFGPLQVFKKTKKFLEKVERGEFKGLHIDQELIDRPMPIAIKLSRDEKRFVNKKIKLMKRRNQLLS